MAQAYGCIEGVYPDGNISGWARREDPAARPRVVALLGGVEIARASCEFQREDLGGRFGFHLPCGGLASGLDVLTGRLRVVVQADAEDGASSPGDLPALEPTEDARRMCWGEVEAMLAVLSGENLAEFADQARREAERRRSGPADARHGDARHGDARHGDWRDLTVLRLSDVKGDPGTVVLDEEVRDWERPPAAFVLDLSAGSFPNPVEPYRAFLFGPSIRHLRGVYETSHERCLVYGSHHFYPFVGPDDSIQFQGLDDAAFRLDYHIDHQDVHAGYRVPLIARSDAGYRISFDAMTPEDVVELDGDVYFGSPVEPTNWGMWLIQGLQSAWRFRQHGQKGRLLCYSGEPFQRMLLAFVGIDENRIVDMAQWRAYRCERLRTLQYSHDTSLSVRPSDREVLDALVRKAERAVPARRRARAIFISRRNVTARKAGTYRPLLNEPELVAAMERLGLDIVEPELLRFEEQVSTFHDAELVVGLGGAGLFNVAFCRPGTRVVTIESSTAFIENHATLFASLGLEYGVIFGRRDATDPSALHYRWTVDVDAVAEQIRNWL